MTRSTTLEKPPRLARISFREKDPVRLGGIGVVAIVVLLAIAFNLHGVIQTFSTYDIRATFAEAGGLKPGDDVRIGGTPVGSVTKVELAGTVVHVDLQVRRGTRLEGGTEARIKTASLLGRKFVGLFPQGAGVLKAGDRIPLERTRSAYDLTQTLGELTRTAQGLDSAELARALDAAVGTFERTPTELARTLTGLRDLSATISSRDDELREVFSRTANLTTQLRSRQGKVERLIVDGNALATELVQQRLALDEIIQRLRSTLVALDTFVDDGEKHLTPALTRLRGLLQLVLRNRQNLEAIIQQSGVLVRSLGDTIGSGPFYTATVGNIVPDGFPIFGTKK